MRVPTSNGLRARANKILPSMPFVIKKILGTGMEHAAESEESVLPGSLRIACKTGQKRYPKQHL